jgi:hypothetical protein
MGMYGNLSDFHLVEFYGANVNHNVIASLPGYGAGFLITAGRVEYSGFGAGANVTTGPYAGTDQRVHFNDGAGIYLDGQSGGMSSVSLLDCDHQYGTCITVGPNTANINISTVTSAGAYFNARPNIVNRCHFALLGAKGVTFTGIATIRNGVNTPYVFCFSGDNRYVNISGAGGGQGSGASTGQWQTAYFLFNTVPTHFNYNIPGVGIRLGNLTEYVEVPYDVGNSGTAFTLDLINGSFQKVTATDNATVTMPALEAGRSFTLRYYTGAGGFTATFTGVKWAGGTAPTLTSTAGRMDLFSFLSDGTSWYGSVSQNYTP